MFWSEKMIGPWWTSLKPAVQPWLATETLLSWAEGRTRQDYTLCIKDDLYLGRGKHRKLSASINAHRHVIWQLLFILKFLHSHICNEEINGNCFSTSISRYMTQESLTTVSGQGIEINYTSLHPALHNFSLAWIIVLCPHSETAMESVVTGFFKKQN